MCKKAFTMVEVVLVMIIMIIIILVMTTTLKPKKYSEQANIAQAQKTLTLVEQIMVQITQNEPVQCPDGKFMVKPAGTTIWEFAIKKADGVSEANSQDLVTLFSKHIKYETGVLNFCDYTNSCSDDEIKGAKIAGGAYIGFYKYSNVGDCPSYYIAGEETQYSAPTRFVDGVQEARQCWGEIHIDVNGLNGQDELGKDVFVYGLGEYTIER